jgi:hypothetical protein
MQPLSQLSALAANGAAGSAICNADAGVVTTESLTTAAGATLTYVINSNQVKAPGEGSVTGTIPGVSLQYGGSQGDPSLQQVQVAQGKLTLKIVNRDAVNPLNGALTIRFILFN